MQRNVNAAIVAGSAALILLVCLFTPWWTAHLSMSGNFGTFGPMNNSGSPSAGPFNDNNLISGGKAAVHGLLVLFGFLAAAATCALALLAPLQRSFARIAPLTAAGSFVLGALAVVLAMTT